MCISPLANGHHYVSYTNTMDGWSTRQVKERERERERENAAQLTRIIYTFTRIEREKRRERCLNVRKE